VALTGGIATGKSYVLDRLRARGVPCLDADDLAHGAMAPGTEATAAIAVRFGADMVSPSGAVDRLKLGRVVFADAAARRDLEAIVHPVVYRALEAGMRAFERMGHRLVVAAVPLLYETGHAADFTRVIATTCTRERQLERLRARGLSLEDAELRLAAQMSAAEKAARADFVVTTDGTKAETDAAVDRLLKMLTPPGA
jgi:dephospho-CoA kinase